MVTLGDNDAGASWLIAWDTLSAAVLRFTAATPALRNMHGIWRCFINTWLIATCISAQIRFCIGINTVFILQCFFSLFFLWFIMFLPLHFILVLGYLILCRRFPTKWSTSSVLAASPVIPSHHRMVFNPSILKLIKFGLTSNTHHHITMAISYVEVQRRQTWLNSLLLTCT